MKIEVKLFTPFDYPDTKETALDSFEPTRTQQQFKEDVNINNIMEKFIQTGGYIDPLIVNGKEPVYGDVSAVADLRESMQIVQQAEEQFMQLPSQLREKFDHDPMKLLEFVADPANLEAAQKLGLVEALPVTTLDVTGMSDTKDNPVTDPSKA